MVMKKKVSFFTTGPMSAISVGLAGRTLLSESSCSPVIASCNTTTIRIAVVIWKNWPRLTRMVPRTKLTPNKTASPIPNNAPIPSSIPDVSSRTAMLPQPMSNPTPEMLKGFS